MQGFRVEGKACCVFEELRQFAEKHKGITVGEFLTQRKIDRLSKIIDNQLDEIISKVKKEG